MDTKAKFGEMRADMYRELGTSVTTKAYDRRFWKVLDTLLRIVTFGKYKNFMKGTTTIGKWIAFGEDTDLYNPTFSDLCILVHEKRHVIQYDKMGFFMPLLYLFFPLPIGLAYFRYKFEVEAYKDEMDFAQKHGVSMDPAHFIDALSGPAYVWAWPRKWVKKAFEAQ